MFRAAMGLLAVLACTGCAANSPQTATPPDCHAAGLNPSTPDSQDCPADGQLGVHVSGYAQFGVGAVR